MSATRSASRSFPWYPLGLLVILGIALGLRFWGLERFNTLVFDEVYYAKFANNYLTQTPFFDGHPPLSKYIIAASIWLAERFELGPTIGNELTGSFRTTWSYRWSAALTGAFIPIVVAELVRQVSHNQRFALLSGVFLLLDGLFLVESRYALNNVYLVIFGLLGLLGLVAAARTFDGRARRRARPVTVSTIRWRLQFWGWLSFAGLNFAASASIKWNGLWFLLGAYGCIALAWLYRQLAQRNLAAAKKLRLTRKLLAARQAKGEATSENVPNLKFTENFQFPNIEAAPALDRRLKFQRSLFWQLGQIHPITVALCLGVLPFVIYMLIWIPHLQLNPTATFWGLQHQILTYHQNVKSGSAVHPYCSNWSSWLTMQQPIAYFYQIGIDPTRVLPTKPVIKPEGEVFAVHAMGNPALWWASTAAIGGLLLTTIGTSWHRIHAWLNPQQRFRRVMAQSDYWIACFVLVNYLANLLPWARVSRCIFLYHYMGASVFSMIALAWWCDRAWRYPALRTWVVILLMLIGLAFSFWLPVYLGLPMTPNDYKIRMWSKAWICGANC